MSSSGILSVNSGPLIIRTYLDGSNNNSYVLGQYDVHVSSNLVLTTSTNGLLVPSNNITVSSITVSSINGVVPISNGTEYGDYLFWDNVQTKWKVGSDKISLGSDSGKTGQQLGAVAVGFEAGKTGQQQYAVAIGFEAGLSTQQTTSIAIGYQAGNLLQSTQSIAIGVEAGVNRQQNNCIAIGVQAGNINQSTNAIAIGANAGQTNQQPSCIALGVQAGNSNQQIGAIAIGNLAGSGLQGQYSIAIGANAGQTNQSTNTIILNASGVNVSSLVSSAFYVNPIRNDNSAFSTLQYDINTSEITYSNKTFVIQHPSKQDNYLVHACLEGPESGVYYRGTATISNKFIEVELPDYVPAVASDFTVSLTHILDEDTETECKSYSATRVKNGRFRIYGSPGCVDWVVFGKRDDIEVEPLKSSVDVKGSGPYKWI